MRKLYLFAVAVAMSLTASAQTEHKSIEGDNICVMPKLFTYDDNMYVVSISDDNEVSVYNDDLELVRRFQINIPEYTVRNEGQERKAEVKTVSEDGHGNHVGAMEGDQFVNWKGTWNEAREWAASNGAGIGLEESPRGQFQLWPTDEYCYWEYEKYGKEYPTTYYQWNAEDGTIDEINVSYQETLTGEWETVSESSYNYGGMEKLDFEDYDGNSHPDQGFYLSQTLFNADEKFEYVTNSYEATERIFDEYDRDGDGEIDARTIEHGWQSTGLNIMSEDGTLLQTISSKGYLSWGGISGIIKLNGKIYIVLADEEEAVFYKIDQQNADAIRMTSMPISVKSIHSIDGRRLPAMQRGINIVKSDDGNTRKTLVR